MEDYEFHRIESTNEIGITNGFGVPIVSDIDFGVLTYCYSGSDIPISICDRLGSKVPIHTRTLSEAISARDYGDKVQLTLTGGCQIVGHTMDGLPTGNEVWIKKIHVIPEKYVFTYKVAAMKYLKEHSESPNKDENDPMYLVYTEFLKRDRVSMENNSRYSNSPIYIHREKQIIVLDFKINVDDILKDESDPDNASKGLLMYHYGLDLVLTRRDIGNSDLRHPFSTAAEVNSKINDVKKNTRGTVILTEIIDNNNKCSKKYIVYGNRTIQLIPRKDPLRSNGVYYHHHRHYGGVSESVEEFICRLDDMSEKLGIYDTEEDAVSHGKYDLRKAEELERLKTKSLKDKEQFELEISKLKLHNVEIDAEYDKLKKERDDEYDNKKKHREDYYEERSYRRKDNNELMKYIPAMLSSAAAIAGAFYLLGKNK